MAILHLTGTPTQFQQLLATIPGFFPDHHTITEAGSGQFTISTLLDESVIPDIQAQGVAVSIEVSDAEFAAHMASFDDDGPPIA